MSPLLQTESRFLMTNAFSVSVPIVVTPTFEFAYHIAETASFITIIMLLHFLPLIKVAKETN
jgi:hypothetical protein